MTMVPDHLQDALGDRYVLKREIARGGMATVYLARDVRHQRQVAVKISNEAVSLGADSERFRREIDLVANLRHPHIVPLYDSGEAAGRLYYVMPLITGESLRDRIGREGKLSLADARRIRATLRPHSSTRIGTVLGIATSSPPTFSWTTSMPLLPILASRSCRSPQ